MKVVQFEKKRTAREHEVQNAIVGILKDALARAKNWEYQGVAFAAIDQQGAACTVSSECDNGIALIGAVYHLMTRTHGDLYTLAVTPPPPDNSEEENENETPPEPS